MTDVAIVPGELTVMKIGGSVLTGGAAFRRVAQFLAERLDDRPGSRILAVVSAEQGLTDALQRSARDLAGNPAPDILDLLWSTGELRSVALLVLALQSAGVRAAAANVHQTGLTSGFDGAREDAPCPVPVKAESGGNGRTPRASRWRDHRISALRLRALFARADVVVAPGFLARAPGDRIASLGRGGSDLSAVLMAAGVSAGTCELLKDVPGYFTADPHVTPDAAHIDTIRYDEAIDMARQGCDLVQLHALEAARDLGVPLVVRGLEGDWGTRVI